MSLSSPARELPRCILTDIDGVWTDGAMYYDQAGGELKRFNTSDSAGVLFARQLNIPVGIITGEDTTMVARRAQKLNIAHCYQGVSDKRAVAHQLCGELGLSWEQLAYIGDDIGDMALLQKVGFAAAPANAPDYVKELVHYCTRRSGGQGAFREFVEWLIDRSVGLESVLQKYRTPGS